MRSRWRILVLASLAGMPLAGPTLAQQPSGTFLFTSDIHFDPFDPPALTAALSAAAAQDWPAQFATLTSQTMSPYGKDTNHALFASALGAITATAKDADFAIVTGDFLSHGFEKAAAKLLGVPETDEAVAAMTVKTTVFVAENLAAVLPGKPIFLTLGNNDSSCGDYRIEPGGPYLEQTLETVRRLAGPGLLSPDFDETYRAGGYYSARHPTVVKMQILVVNDVLWSAEYVNACGTNGNAAGDAMLAWLDYKLAAARAAGEHVWLAHHIPWGIDAYSTAHDKAVACPAKIVAFMKEPFASGYVSLLRAYRDVIAATFSGHEHFDDYRVLTDETGAAIGIDKVAPAISPIFGQNPGFQMFAYDRGSGLPTDFTTTYLANLAAAPPASGGDWQREYAFSEAYGQPAYSTATVEAMWKAIDQPGAVQEQFRTLYDVSRGELSPSELAANLCAINNVTPAEFDACFCGG